MLKRIQSLRELEAQTGSEEDSVPSGMSVTEYTSGIEKGKPTELRGSTKESLARSRP